MEGLLLTSADFAQRFPQRCHVHRSPAALAPSAPLRHQQRHAKPAAAASAAAAAAPSAPSASMAVEALDARVGAGRGDGDEVRVAQPKVFHGARGLVGVGHYSPACTVDGAEETAAAPTAACRRQGMDAG